MKQIIRHNYTEPCPHCGIPACGREDMLWYEESGKRITILVDGGHLDLELEAYFNQNRKRLDVTTLPQFMQEWHACNGWVDTDTLDGYALNIIDFRDALLLLQTNYPLEWLHKELLNQLLELAQEAQDKGSTLKILRG